MAEHHYGGVGRAPGTHSPAAGDGSRPYLSVITGPSREEKIMAITLTKKAEEKVREILSDQPEPYAGLRIQVVGGGCSGFSYRMGFDKAFNDQSDQIFEFDGLKVFVDKKSLLS